MLEAPDVARNIAAAAHAAGGRAFIVGGWVRDALRGRPSKDVDLEVFGIPEAALPTLLSRFGRVEAVGQSFPVYKVVADVEGDRAEIDVALPRRESKAGRGHKAFRVEGDPHMSIAEAARRRDFTVNAISLDPLTGAFEDPFDGRSDLANRLLRVVDPATFGDDSLRVLRAVQFAARFEFTLDPVTFELCRAIPLDDLPAERIWGEFEKLLLQAPRPSLGLRLAWELGVVERLWPELTPLAACPQDPEWHPEGDVWTHTLLVVDEARARNGDLPRPQLLAVMLGALCHDLGKPATTSVIDGRIRSPGHEEAGVPPTLSLLDRLNVHAIDGYDVRGQVAALVAQHLKPGQFHKAPSVSD
ncbi:MAG: CCA tRNA nucleotidyltransferase, partial [Vicinamibacterales bacterium]